MPQIPLVIGIAGTAKNTGKTTTMSAIMDALNQRNISYVLTSIGYDGEELDHVTKLPKPRLQVIPGNLVAVAEKCFYSSSAVIDVKRKTGIQTALGEILIGQVIQSGLLVIAGPNTGKDLQRLTDILGDLGSQLILVDGALNRLAPMIYTHGFILATGASRHQEIDVLVRESSSIEEICQLPLFSKDHFKLTDLTQSEDIRLMRRDSGSTSETRSYPFSSLLSPKSLDDILISIKYDFQYLWVPGVVSLTVLKELISSPHTSGLRIIFHDPTKILVTGDVLQYIHWIREGRKKNMQFYIKKSLELAFFTINPFFPRYRAGVGVYEPAYIDGEKFIKEMCKGLETPVLNVEVQGVEKIVDWLLKKV